MMQQNHPSLRWEKRCFDLVVTVPILILLSPVMAMTALCVFLNLGVPVIFRQRRPGLRGNLFTIYKFRTMTEARNGHGRLLPDVDRLAPFGKFLRALSLDELPTLINVLKGDMSIVGPRPLLKSYLDRYSPDQMRRHNVKPGITGWAQVNGRNALAWEEQFKLDVWYVDHESFWLDVKIFAFTLWTVLKRDGISQPGKATKEIFMGSQGGLE